MRAPKAKASRVAKPSAAQKMPGAPASGAHPSSGRPPSNTTAAPGARSRCGRCRRPSGARPRPAGRLPLKTAPRRRTPAQAAGRAPPPPRATTWPTASSDCRHRRHRSPMARRNAARTRARAPRPRCPPAAAAQTPRTEQMRKGRRRGERAWRARPRKRRRGRRSSRRVGCGLCYRHSCRDSAIWRVRYTGDVKGTKPRTACVQERCARVIIARHAGSRTPSKAAGARGARSRPRRLHARART